MSEYLFDVNDTYEAMTKLIVFANELQAIHRNNPRGEAAKNLIVAAENLQDLLDEFQVAPSYDPVAWTSWRTVAPPCF